jgi:FMN phosphatase YigB (HAD superfamily)
MKNWKQSRVSDLLTLLERCPKKLLIWDFDKTLVELDWFSDEPFEAFFERLYRGIRAIDSHIIDDKQAFFRRLFPYPEIDTIARHYGPAAADTVKAILFQKERSCRERGRPEDLLIRLIANSEREYSHAIWSNNHQETIRYFLQANRISNRIGSIASYDQVSCAKPHPEGFEIIRKAYPDIALDQILLIGDSLRSDSAAAAAVEIDFFLWADSNSLRV